MLVSGSACVDAAETNTPGSDNASSYFEEYIDHPLFIASRGIFPETIDQEWENSVSKCWLSISTEKSLVEFDPSVDSIGGGELLEVYLSSSYQGKINESKIDEIYQRIDEYCEQEAGISEIPVVFMWAEDEEDLPLPDYGPEILEKARNSSSVIAVYGTMPVIEKESEKRAWTDRLGHSKEREVSPYFAEFGGPVLSYGVSINGYLFVGMDLESPEKVNDSIINEIYQAIESHFEQEADITDVPVVFRWEDRVVLCLAADDNTSDGNIIVRDDDGNLINYSKDEAYYDEDGNLVIVGNETTQGETGTSNKAPGFTSIMLIIGLFLLAMSRK
jgi:hypothetical protein